LLLFSSLILLALPVNALLWVFVFSYGFAFPARDVVFPLVLGRCFGLGYLGEIYGAMMLALPGARWDRSSQPRSSIELANMTPPSSVSRS